MDDKIILETERTYLRPICLEDFAELAAILGDRQVMYAWEHAFSDEEIYDWIQENLVRYARDGYSYWAVVLKHTNRLIGVAGLLREYVGEDAYIGLGYIFHKDFWHQGFALECAEACKQYAFHVLQIPLLTAQIRPDNMSSRKTAERLGMSALQEFERVYRGKRIPHILYGCSK